MNLTIRTQKRIRMMTNNAESRENERLALIIVAAGSSSRIGRDSMGRKIKKEYLPMKGGTVLSCAAKAFLSALHFDVVAVTYPFSPNSTECAENESASRNALFADDFVKNYGAQFIFVPGGETRQESVHDALEAVGTCGEPPSLVFIHDGARPFVTEETILLTYRAASEFGAAVPGLQPVETQKKIDDNGFIVKHLDRSHLSAVQTPQVFQFEPILEGHRRASESGRTFTDDTEIWSEYVSKKKNGAFLNVKVVLGDPENKKITYPEDLKLL